MGLLYYCIIVLLYYCITVLLYYCIIVSLRCLSSINYRPLSFQPSSCAATLHHGVLLLLLRFSVNLFLFVRTFTVASL